MLQRMPIGGYGQPQTWSHAGFPLMNRSCSMLGPCDSMMNQLLKGLLHQGRTSNYNPYHFKRDVSQYQSSCAYNNNAIINVCDVKHKLKELSFNLP